MLIPPDTVLIFAAASVALALAPGPDNIFVLTQSALYGRMAGVMVTLGLMTGVMVHTTLVALGVAVIFQSSVIAFTVLKLVGAGYLVYLAIMAFRAPATPVDQAQAPRTPLARLYWRGVVMNLTNPKVAIFFLAFLPQFADPLRGTVTVQIFLFGAIFVLCAFVVFCTIAGAAGFLGTWLSNSPRAHVALNRVAGVVFLGLALRLVLAER
ncbi:LysE family translocator [Roseobacter litoralis]|uniref:LysE family translocator n=1 Tax=Roseobacter litoralis TaxID=42443 RepID=UPI00249486FA|nr:LysE family translocator [Roseobacter litoralis]